jgi:hypothetical protein
MHQVNSLQINNMPVSVEFESSTWIDWDIDHTEHKNETFKGPSFIFVYCHTDTTPT